MSYKGIDNTLDNKVIRSVSINEAGGQLGFGFLHKFGKKIDEKDSKFYYYSIIYVIRGSGLYIDSEGNQYKLKSGSIFQRFPGETHTTILDPDSKWSECYMDFGTEIFNFLVSMRIINRTIPVYKLAPNKTIEDSIFDCMIKLENCAESELPDLLIKSITLLQSIFNQCKLKDQRDIPKKVVDKSCSDLTKDLSQRINLIEYCNNNGLGYESFRKVFKESIGVSPGKYIVRRRIDMACQMLISLDRSIKQIADELGYKSQYEFSSQFKKNTGISPYHFRVTK
ncbi:MAG: AraC family transcriptional regulator [Spirochaetaceae bacterium]